MQQKKYVHTPNQRCRQGKNRRDNEVALRNGQIHKNLFNSMRQ